MVDQELLPSPNCLYKRLKVGKLHILRLFPPGHLFYLTKEMLVRLHTYAVSLTTSSTLSRMVVYEEFLFTPKATAILLSFTNRQNYSSTTELQLIFG